MNSQESNAFEMLAKPVRDALQARGFASPTDPQLKAIPEIIAGKNVLLISPTASGKTEAAVLPVFSMYMTNRGDDRGIKILYVTPLRALNRDMLERFEWWAERLDLKIAVRHGDTEVRERATQAKNPPDMLILTPETLQAILTGRIMKQHLRAVKYVIVDEVHELAEDKRGSQLAIALERLRWAAMHDFQMIGLSATIGSPDKVAKFLVGTSREFTIIHVPVGRQVRIEVVRPEPEARDLDLSMQLYTHPDVAARLRLMRDLIETHRSVLLFTNTRAVAEILTSRLKVWDVDFPISIHHGSLARPSRISAERGLKDGQLKGLIATSSLELGIDVGNVDFVIQYMSPRQVSRLIQRIGRSGHRIGRLADGIIIAMDSDDTLESLVIARRALEETLEQVSVPEKPLDVLAHQIVGLLIQKGRWYINEILEIVTKAFPYRNLTEQDVAAILNYMHSRFPRLAWYSEEDTLALRPRNLKALYSYYFGKLSMIPDERQYLIIDQSNDEAVGVLDEAFVAEYAEPGRKFIVRGSPWRMVSIRADKIYVRPIRDPTGSIPSWVGEEIPVPFEVAQEVGAIRRKVETALGSGITEVSLLDELSQLYPASTRTIQNSLSETLDQARQGLVLPTDKRIVLEDWEDFVIVNAHFGLLVNRTLARLIGHVLSEDIGTTIGVQQDAYRIVIQTTGAANAFKVAQVLQQLSGMELESVIREASKKSGMFKRRLVHVAKRFGAITRYAEFQSVKLRQVMKSFEGTVIMEEAFKETLEKDLDLKNTKLILNQLGRDIEVSFSPSARDPTPIARIGIERISRKTDLIPPDKMKRILIESTKVRILNESRLLACPSCLNYARIVSVKDMPETFECPKCKNPLGMSADTPDSIEKIRKKRTLSESEKRTVDALKASSLLIRKNGKIVAYILAGRRLSVADARAVLRRTHRVSDRLFEQIMEQEKKALRRRFW
ncbi:MAG TPA: DEAD/DEAH box helicase [Methylomirabilota bacterium]|nr:DEAD/DEAH box helicase [Methylomirabilota bacterium]